MREHLARALGTGQLEPERSAGGLDGEAEPQERAAPALEINELREAGDLLRARREAEGVAVGKVPHLQLGSPEIGEHRAAALPQLGLGEQAGNGESGRAGGRFHTAKSIPARVARNPLFGLPPLPAMDLPLSPFKNLAPFTRDDAPVFFGRGREIRELYEEVTRPDGAPVVLLFGPTGAGKSSLLGAGLLPRLEASHEVLSLRRDRAFGLAGTLARALGDDDAGAAWHRREETAGKPLAVIMHQAEEAWTRPLTHDGEIEDFSAVLRTLFAVRETRPRGRLVLGFREEWLAKVLRLLDDEKLPRTRVEVAHLDRDGIEEAVLGPASSSRLQRHYGLEIDSELPARIAGDLIEQRAATIAPILQILLTQMWTQAKAGSASPRFTLDLYDMKT